MVGSFVPFARSKAERSMEGDPRLSIEERYPSRSAYLAKVKAAAELLAREGYLLEPDLADIVSRAGIEWDYLQNPVLQNHDNVSGSEVTSPGSHGRASEH